MYETDNEIQFKTENRLLFFCFNMQVNQKWSEADGLKANTALLWTIVKLHYFTFPPCQLL